MLWCQIRVVIVCVGQAVEPSWWNVSFVLKTRHSVKRFTAMKRYMACCHPVKGSGTDSTEGLYQSALQPTLLRSGQGSERNHGKAHYSRCGRRGAGFAGDCIARREPAQGRERRGGGA